MIPADLQTPAHQTDQATARQRLASDPSFSAWVSANAGTGKTRVLVDRISRLLLAGVQAERILCLTFTKAAAAEMQNRLSQRLGTWATMDDEAVREELLVLTGRVADGDDIRRARQLFASTLEAPGGLKIRTIHAFCESLLGRFPVEAGIVPHAAVMDERTAAELQAEAMRQVFGSANAEGDGNLIHSMVAMAGLLDEQGFAELLREILAKRRWIAGLMETENDHATIAALISRHLGIPPDVSADQLLSVGTRESAFDRQALQRAISALKTGSLKDKERAQSLAHWLSLSDGDRQTHFDDLYKPVFLQKTDDQPRASSNLITKKPAQDSPDALAVLLAEQDRVFELSQSLKASAIKEATLHLVSIAWALIQEYQNLKHMRALLDYDDLILKVLDLLNRDGGVGWVHYKLDGGIDHILVDEAQDTSPEQWEIVRHLSTDFFAGEGVERRPDANDQAALPNRTIFAVGDEKQSIYSFQGADPVEFRRMRDHFAQQAGNRLRSVQLEQSFRSTSAILNVVDAVFSSPEARKGVADEDGTNHLAKRSGHGGVVELWPSFKKTPSVDPDPWYAPVDRVRVTSPMVQTVEQVAETVDKWLKSGECLQSQNRPIEPGDIMILVPTRGQFADEMVRRFKTRGIPVAGSDRMVMTEQIAVMDLLAAARFTLLPEDDLILATVLKTPFIGLDEDALFELAHDREGSLWQSLTRTARSAGEPYATAYQRLSTWLGQADFMPPFEFFSTLLGPEGGRQRLIARLGPEATDPIDEFINQTLAFEQSHTPSLQGFIAWIDHASTEIKRDLEMAGGMVRVMTVHGSKGLESNIVILPDTCATPDSRKSDQILWAEDRSDGKTDRGKIPLWPGPRRNETTVCSDLREDFEESRLEEYRRLFYVAMTRARDRLYVAGWERKGSQQKDGSHGRHEGSWYELIKPALEKMDTIETVSMETGEILRFSSSQTDDPEPDSSPAQRDAISQPLPGWLAEHAPEEPEPSIPLSPSRLDDQEPAVSPPLEDGNTARFRRGTLIHRLLQTLPDIAEDQRSAAARRWLSTSARDLDDEEREALVQETLGVLYDSRFSIVFGAGSLAEVPIAGTVTLDGRPRTISGLVDRLVVTDRDVVVVDFKTNRPPPKSPEDVPGPYVRQMAIYKAALSQIYPDREIHCILVWTDGPSATALDNDRLSTYLS